MVPNCICFVIDVEDKFNICLFKCHISPSVYMYSLLCKAKRVDGFAKCVSLVVSGRLLFICLNFLFAMHVFFYINSEANAFEMLDVFFDL